MGFFDKIFGGGDPQPQQPQYTQPQYGQPQGGQQFVPQGAMSSPQGAGRPLSADEQAVARYRYMLQTAPPEEVEQAHQEAFARLTPEQRRLALQQLAQVTPQNEQHSLSDDPQSLARAATRAEMRQPGAMERVFGGQQQGGMMSGMGGGLLGGGMMGGLLTGLAGGFVGSAIANSFFNNPMHQQGYEQTVNNFYGDGNSADAGGYDANNYDPNANIAPDMSNAQPYENADPYGDPADAGGFDVGGGDIGGDFGGGDFGGGDFGGGDFGGGDF